MNVNEMVSIVEARDLPRHWKCLVEKRHDLDWIATKRFVVRAWKIVLVWSMVLCAIAWVADIQSIDDIFDKSFGLTSAFIILMGSCLLLIFVTTCTVLRPWIMGRDESVQYAYTLTSSYIKIEEKILISDAAKKRAQAVKYTSVTVTLLGVAFLVVYGLINNAPLRYLLPMLPALLALPRALQKHDPVPREIALKNISTIEGAPDGQAIRIKGNGVPKTYLYCNSMEASLIRLAHAEAAG